MEHYTALVIICILHLNVHGEGHHVPVLQPVLRAPPGLAVHVQGEPAEHLHQSERSIEVT